jgi:hypothetical protein
VTGQRTVAYTYHSLLALLDIIRVGLHGLLERLYMSVLPPGNRLQHELIVLLLMPRYTLHVITEPIRPGRASADRLPYRFSVIIVMTMVLVAGASLTYLMDASVSAIALRVCRSPCIITDLR